MRDMPRSDTAPMTMAPMAVDVAMATVRLEDWIVGVSMSWPIVRMAVATMLPVMGHSENTDYTHLTFKNKLEFTFKNKLE